MIAAASNSSAARWVGRISLSPWTRYAQLASFDRDVALHAQITMDRAEILVGAGPVERQGPAASARAVGPQIGRVEVPGLVVKRGGLGRLDHLRVEGQLRRSLRLRLRDNELGWRRPGREGDGVEQVRGPDDRVAGFHREVFGQKVHDLRPRVA